MYVYIYTQKQKQRRKKKGNTHIYSNSNNNSNLGVHNTPYIHNKETRTTSINVIEDDIMRILSAMSDEK
jgi:hypothetical protein